MERALNTLNTGRADGGDNQRREEAMRYYGYITVPQLMVGVALLACSVVVFVHQEHQSYLLCAVVGGAGILSIVTAGLSKFVTDKGRALSRSYSENAKIQLSHAVDWCSSAAVLTFMGCGGTLALMGMGEFCDVPFCYAYEHRGGDGEEKPLDNITIATTDNGHVETETEEMTLNIPILAIIGLLVITAGCSACVKVLELFYASSLKFHSEASVSSSESGIATDAHQQRNAMQAHPAHQTSGLHRGGLMDRVGELFQHQHQPRSNFNQPPPPPPTYQQATSNAI